MNNTPSPDLHLILYCRSTTVRSILSYIFRITYIVTIISSIYYLYLFRSSGVKSKVNKLKLAYNTRQSVSLAGSEPAVVASLLKLFLRELPNPVLTQLLIPKFEEVAKVKDVAKMFDGLNTLVRQLPECNRTLLEWVLVHMNHVILNEKQNKKK